MLHWIRDLCQFDALDHYSRPQFTEVATGTVGTDACRLQRIGNLLLGGCRYTSFGRLSRRILFCEVI